MKNKFKDEKKVYTLLDKTGYTIKPKDKMDTVNYNLINNEIQIPIQDFIIAKENGHATSPVFCANEYGNIRIQRSLFAYTEVIELDFDTGISFCNVKQRLDKYNIKIGFAYNTLSNDGKNNKFRVCFFLDSCISSATIYESVVKTFMIMFPECDGACKNANRIYLGGKEIIYKSQNVETERTTIHSIFSGVQQYIKDTQYNKYSKIMRDLATTSSLMLSSNTIWLKQRFITKEQASTLYENQRVYENIDCCSSHNWCANKELHFKVFRRRRNCKFTN